MRIWEIRADERFLFKHVMPKSHAYTYRFKFIYFDNAILTMYTERIYYTNHSRKWDWYVPKLTMNHFLTSFFKDKEDYINRIF